MITRQIVQQMGQQTDNKRTTDGHIGNNEERMYKNVNTLNPAANAAPKEPDGVNEVFRVFYENGNPAIKFGNKTQRADAKFLIEKFGLEQTLSIAQYACKVQGTPYAPTITTPSQLRERLAALKGFAERQKINLQGSITFIT